MEKENDKRVMSEDEFLNLLALLQEHNDEAAALKLLEVFEADMLRLSRFMKMPREDALQTMKLELIALLKRRSG